MVKVHDVVYAGSTDHRYRLTVTTARTSTRSCRPSATPGVPTTFTLLGRNLGGEPAPEPDGRRPPAGTQDRDARRPPGVARPRPGYPTRGLRPAPGAARTGIRVRAWRRRRGRPTPCSSPRRPTRSSSSSEPNDEPRPAQAVAVPCDISGTFGAPGDLDVYRFRAKKGEVFWIEADAERIGSPADPAFVVQKVNEKGGSRRTSRRGDDTGRRRATRRGSSPGSVDAAVRWQVPEDGLIQVVVSDLYALAARRRAARLPAQHPARAARLPTCSSCPTSPNQPDAVTVRAGGRALAYVLAVRARRLQRADPGRGGRPAAGRPVRAGGDRRGSVLAPVVFEADEDARPAVGTVRLVGRARFGDRKDEVGYVAGATTLGPDVAAHGGRRRDGLAGRRPPAGPGCAGPAPG